MELRWNFSQSPRIGEKRRVGRYEIYAFITIVGATTIRILLAAQGWPLTNSDEDTIGIMAMHIAYRGEHPIFFYGQNYMGTLEAYLGAALFHVFGASLLALRLGIILLFALFLVSTYFLTSLLYTKKLALFTLVLLSLGSSAMLTHQLSAIGGYPETVLFGSLAFLLASWLTLSSCQDRVYSRSTRWQRLVGYGCWGCTIGLGLWSDLLILPFVCMAGILLVLYCWRELRSWALLWLMTGMCLGALPLILYNITAAQGQDSLSVLWHLHQAGSAALAHLPFPLVHQIAATVSISLPEAMGNPFCPVTELPFLGGDISAPSLQCTIIRSSWGVGYLMLWFSAVSLAILACWRLRKIHSLTMPAAEVRKAAIRYSARLLLLASAGLALLLFILSTAPVIWPSIFSRYLVGLLIATPALLWPLWNVGGKITQSQHWLTLPKVYICRGILLILALVFLTGTLKTFAETPTTQVVDQQQSALIKSLVQLGVSHIYTDYWTCDRIAFLSQEHIICAVIDGHFRPVYNRYGPYYAIVIADPHAAYVFPFHSWEAHGVAQKMALSHKHYQEHLFDGYVIFLQ